MPFSRYWIFLVLFISKLSLAGSYLIGLEEKPLDDEASLRTYTTEGIAAVTKLITGFSFYPTFLPFVEKPETVDQVLWSIQSFTADLDDRQLTKLLSSGIVAYVTPMQTYKLAGDNWALDNMLVTDAQVAYPSIDGTGIVVGILDSGIDPTHPDLAGKLIAWYDAVEGLPDPYLENGVNHGENIAGYIAGGCTSGTCVGVAPNVRLAVSRVSVNGNINDIYALPGAQWLLNYDGMGHKVDVVNCSWGASGDWQFSTSPATYPWYRMVNIWNKFKVFPVFAAGNSGPSASSINYPAGLPNAFSVGNVQQDNTILFDSSRGPISWTNKNGPLVPFVKPDVVAPGTYTYTTDANGGYIYGLGTSFSAAYVTGIVALIKQTRPGLTNGQIVKILERSATGIPNSYTVGNTYGRGIVNVKKALDITTSGTDPAIFH